MFTKILIANRGEIACRVIKTARRMGVATVAVYSDADRNALHVAMADEAVHVGGAAPAESYLVAERIVEAALKTGAQAIHPGYGFLSENAAFSELCDSNGLVFIGPPASAIEAMGSKSAAKVIMEKAGVPLVPGYHGDNQDPAFLKEQADAMGYPVLLKAVAGGGGKGMRQVWESSEFHAELEGAKRESQASFGNSDMLVEKYLTQPRHVEFQVFCDTQGNGVYLFERDCSVQRRHQKIIEEAPAPGVDEALRARMGEAALLAARSINYVGAGTVEFLLDVTGEFYFMEMNTRLQVEHPVTEMITRQDLVEWQLRVAAGEALPAQQADLRIHGHAFEARVYAEDPDNDFLPVTGTLQYLEPPREGSHVRVDSGVVQGDEVSVYYDPMIAKLIVWDESRERALARLASALRDYRISGITTNLRFLYNLATAPSFRGAELDTGFIEKHHEEVFHDGAPALSQQLPLAALYLLLAQERAALGLSSGSGSGSGSGPSNSPWRMAGGWRLNARRRYCWEIQLKGETHAVPMEQIGEGEHRHFLIGLADKTLHASGRLEGHTLHAEIDGHRSALTIVPVANGYTVFSDSDAWDFAPASADLGAEEDDLHGGFNAPMNGTIVAVLAQAGEQVERDAGLVIMEAMKMEHTIRAPSAGTVDEVFFSAGELVSGGQELLRFTPATDPADSDKRDSEAGGDAG